MIGRKLTKEHIRKILHKRGKSKLEIKFENIINDLGLNYTFVGNGNFFIKRKNPDFINHDKKIALEVYYTKHKEMFRNGVKEWMTIRKKIFNDSGWRIEFFNESEVNKEEIIRRCL